VATASTLPPATNLPFAAGTTSVSLTLTTMPQLIRVPSGVTITPNASYGFSATPVP
jgi:hypothetical protein